MANFKKNDIVEIADNKLYDIFKNTIGVTQWKVILIAIENGHENISLHAIQNGKEGKLPYTFLSNMLKAV